MSTTDHGGIPPHADELVKVTFELEPSDWHSAATESMWARPVGPGIFQLENIPFYVYGVSVEDVIGAELQDELILFKSVVKRGGHSNYRIFLLSDTSEQKFAEHWMALKLLGCRYERATNYLVAVDVPPKTDIYAAYSELKLGESKGWWDFEEGHCGHPLKE